MTSFSTRDVIWVHSLSLGLGQLVDLFGHLGNSVVVLPSQAGQSSLLLDVLWVESEARLK